MSSEPRIHYTAEFYEQHLQGSLESARRLLGRVLELHPATSLLDVGCGRGAWLRAARELGVGERLGLDGTYVDVSTLLVDPSEFRGTDLSQPIHVPRRFDLTVSVEVAEHLDFDRADGFVRDLTTTSDVILFSAAAPYQGGAGHVNEQWPELWAILFRKYGFRCFDPLRTEFWSDRRVEPWYAQNIFVFARESSEGAKTFAPFAAEGKVLSRIHPELVFHNATRIRPHSMDALEAEIADWHAIVDAWLLGADALPALATVASRSTRLHGFPETRTTYSSAWDLANERAALEARLRAFEAARDEIEIRLHESQRSWARERVQLVDAFTDALARALLARPTTNTAVVPAPTPVPAAQRGWKRRLASVAPVAVSKTFRRMRIQADVKVIRESGQFDADFYLRSYPDVASSGIDPVLHYVEFGVREGRRPRADFDASLVREPGATELPRNPFALHILRMAGSSSPTAGVRLAAPAPLRDVITRSSCPARYGAVELSLAQLFPGASPLPSHPELYALETERIVATFAPDDLSGTRSLLTRFGPGVRISEIMRSRVADPAVPATSAVPTYSLVTPYFAHDAFFRECARSVAALVAHDRERTGRPRIEWIVMNDDPRRSSKDLEELLPPELRPLTRVLSDGKNKGIAARQNEGVALARNEWVVLLDCDDVIFSRALDVVDHYAAAFPRCRYISGAMVDVDPETRELRRRKRDARPDELFGAGMVVGHLVSIRRDLFDEVGTFDPAHSGCQDYDFAMRVALREPVLQIPEHLSAYRWHRASQSVGHANRQHRIAESVRRSIADGIVRQRWPSPRAPSTPLPRSPKGICLVRTQGKRLELLSETVRSIWDQSLPMIPCVIVHADAETHAIVQRFVQGIVPEAVVLHAPDTKRRRGYPLNVALEYVEAHADTFGFFSFLDDDDIYYPGFAERLVRALELSDADVAVGMANARGRDGRLASMYPLLPAATLVVGNSIPNNAYVVRTEVLARTHPRFREDIDYLEDWDFLVSLLSARCRFHAHHETLSEFRLIGDGNTAVRKDPEHFAHCMSVVRAHGLLVASQLGEGEFYRSVLELDLDARPPLSADEVEMLSNAAAVFGANGAGEAH